MAPRRGAVLSEAIVLVSAVLAVAVVAVAVYRDAIRQKYESLDARVAVVGDPPAPPPPPPPPPACGLLGAEVLLVAGALSGFRLNRARRGAAGRARPRSSDGRATPVAPP